MPFRSLLPARGVLRGRLFPWGHRSRERAVGRRSAKGLEITFWSHVHGGMGV